MNKVNNRKVWKHPWSYLEGTIVTGTIILCGFVLQAAGGGVLLRLPGFPWNLISGVLFITVLNLSFFFLKKEPVIKWLGSVKAALPAILGFTSLALLMGLVKQDVKSSNTLVQLLGLNYLTKTWAFRLINLYLLILLGIVTLRRLTPYNLKNAGFFLNHFGLFLVLLSSALGSSDICTLNMNCYKYKAENRVSDENGKMIEIPLTIKLLNFNIEQYRPKVAILDNKSREIVMVNGHQICEMLDHNSFDLLHYNLEVVTFFSSSAKVGENYHDAIEPGSSPSARIKVTNLNDYQVTEGWICSGSYLEPPDVLKLNDKYSLIMLPAEPEKFSSEVYILTKNGTSRTGVIEVNQPLRIDGWTIYQLGYNTEMGRWSDSSILQLVHDPWLPVVYSGIFLMMAGAIFLFIFGKPISGGTEYVA